MSEAAGQAAEKGSSRRLLGKGLSGVLIVAALAAVFFVFYVSPQSQFERDRIYRSMNDVSRLLDDKTEAADQTFQIWQQTLRTLNASCASVGETPDVKASECQTRLDKTVSDVVGATKSELPGFAFGCERSNIICLGPKSAPPRAQAAEQAGTVETGARPKNFENASVMLESIAQGARLPYPQAILLIMNTNGQILAGSDADGKWKQFQTLGPLIGIAQAKAAQSSPGTGADIARFLGAAQRSGRGAENAVFEGYPARLSTSIGGQGYSIFIAAYQIGRSRSGSEAGGANPTDIRIQRTKEDAKTSPAPSEDFLYFAYVIPDRVIDSAALRIPPEWTVNILLSLICALLAIPFLKLFTRSPLKPIPILDLGALLIALMLIVTTATLVMTAVMLRSSMAQDIEKELSVIARSVSRNVHGQANIFAGKEAMLARYTDRWRALTGANQQQELQNQRWPYPSQRDLYALASLQSAFLIDRSGNCANAGLANCGEGLWFGRKPSATQINVSDRAYFKAWQTGDPAFGTGKYVQFVRNKSNGRLSWSYIVRPPADLRDSVCASRPDERGSVSPNQDCGYVISAMPLALRMPVLPRNFSFMIVLNSDLPETLRSMGSERAGDVQYHSDQPRSLIENVLREARDNPRLAAAIWTLRAADGRDGPEISSPLIPINYHGTSHFALVRPIAGMPLSVITLFDRSETQGLFAQTVAQSFFVCCFWILLCMGVCWITPRLMRLTLNPRRSKKAGLVPLRGRSIWFFPNGLFRHVPDGFSYAAQAGVDELLLVGVVLAAQAASYLLLAPAGAVIAIGLCSLMALIGEYLLIARPSHGGLNAGLRHTLIGVLCIPVGLSLFVVLTRGSNWLVPVIVVVLALAAGGRLYSTRKILKVAANARKLILVHPDRSQVAAIRRAFLSRGFGLLMIVVAIPTCGFLNLMYYENLKGYVGASLITASEQIADQRAVLRQDFEDRFATDKTDQWMRGGLGDDGFGHQSPGWYFSDSNGIFSVFPPGPGALRACSQGDLLTRFVEQMTPHYASSNSEVRDSAERVREMCGAGGKHWFDLAAPADYVAPGTSLGSKDARPTLRAGPSMGLSLHPAWDAWVLVLLCSGLFVFFFYGLLKKAATCLTGLYLSPAQPTKEARDRLNASIDEDPAKAWAEVSSDAKRVRLLALACSSTLNFSDRAPIHELVEQGYLELTPYIRIANPRLTDFLRYDLPRAERGAILARASQQHDHWDRMRMPVFFAVGAACVLMAYTAPNAIELMMSAFLTVTALVPLTQDPVGRFLGAQRNAS